MLHLISLLQETWATGQWFVFEIYVMFVWACMLPRMVLAGVFYFLRNGGWIQNYPLKKHRATTLLTIYEENLETLELAMRKTRESLELGTTEFFFIAIVDGYKKDKVWAEQQAEIARKYAHVVLMTSARNKRKNLRAMLREARRRGRLYEITILHDSDTVPTTSDVVLRLLAPFCDPRVGIVTTAQLIHNAKRWIQKICFWQEDARLNSSLAAASLVRQVPCAPGRMTAVRTDLIEGRMDELVNDSFSYFGFMRRPCIAGDDRVITSFVLQAGKCSILVPDALVTTSAPETFGATQRMWTRWGRSSQGYTIRSPWLIKFPLAFFICWSDIFISLATVYIVAVHWPLTFIYGTSTLPLLQSFVMAIIGMLLTMIIRQFPHLWKYPRSWWILPVFVLVVTYAQFIRVYALFTQHKISTWGGARSGGDMTNTLDDRVWIVHEDYPAKA